jgi:hypothetical protein
LIDVKEDKEISLFSFVMLDRVVGLVGLAFPTNAIRPDLSSPRSSPTRWITFAQVWINPSVESTASA